MSNILISGSGIAGSVFAYWLLRAYPNASITIVERSPAPRLTGASVDIRSTAVDIIKWMGTEEEIRKHSTKETGVAFLSPKGKPVAVLGATGRTDVQSFTSEFEIFRGGLTQIFNDKVKDRVKLVYGEYVDHYKQFDDHVEVTFAKGKETETYDLLVAADGFSSKIRGMMHNSDPRDQIFDEGVHAAYFTMKNDLLKDSLTAQWYNATRGRVILIRPDPTPGLTRGHFMKITTRGDTEMKKKLNDAVEAGNDAYADLMEEEFHDAGWYAPEVLKAMRESDDFYCTPFAQIRAPILHDGRVVLLGDSGYATPGFGTSLAIMGGYVLAGEIMNNSGDLKLAAKGYADLMRPFAKSSQGGDQAMQILNPQTQWAITLRNIFLGTIVFLRIDKLAVMLAALFGMNESKLKMPDYQWPAEKST